ncbi:MAG: hypothetical protein SFW35_05535 [Chitinophagales bacterium]|nr:hypothetical protein [Chitinophagales bacterium]
MKKSLLIGLNIMTLLLISSSHLFAGAPPPPPPPPAGIPVDAGALILLLIGAGIAANTLYKGNSEQGTSH